MAPALLALLLAAAPAPVEGPVAVLPFKNLGNDPSLEWLRLGMAETLVADLRRARKLAVVERSEVERALAQVAQAGAAASDEAGASQVGKLVAAKTVVLGSFQRSGGQVRLAARFVSVETGVVADAAKATGPITAAFTVQDLLVAALLGAPADGPRRRGRADRAVRAFELYGRSLAATSDADRAGLLRQSVAADPAFSYAVEELAALEARLQGYAKASAAALPALEQALLAQVEDARAPKAERLAAATRLLDGLAAARRFNTLAELARRVAAAQGLDAAEPAAHAAFAAQLGLHRFDQALAAGERFLKGFPASPRFRAVEGELNAVVAARKKRAARQKEFETDLAEKREGCPGKGALECDYAPCIATRWNSLVGAQMLGACSAFLKSHAADRGPEAAEKVAAARFFVALSLVELGRWAEADAALVQLLQSGSHDWDDEVATLRASWPAD